jgi:hypothetical protein
MIISHRVLLRMRSISDKSCRENQNTYYILKKFSKNHTIYEIIWKNMMDPDRPQIKIYNGSSTFHAGYLKLQAHTQNIYCKFLFHSNSGYMNMHQYHIICAQPVLLFITLELFGYYIISKRCLMSITT